MGIRLNPAVRLTPPTALREHWSVEHLLERRRFRVSVEAAAALVASSRPQERDDLARSLAAVDGSARPAAYWGGVLDALRRHSLLVDRDDAQDEDLAWLTALRKRWSDFGWHESAEYHLLTFDYPCLDYTEALSAIATDQATMRSFQRAEPDTDRVKLDYAGRPGVLLPDPEGDLGGGSVREVWGTAPPSAAVDAESLSAVLALTFGSTGVRTPRTDSAPLLRRTSPSGGGRHPSEGYVLILDVPGFEPGWYHVTMRPFSLRHLGGEMPDIDRIEHELFPETLPRFPFDIKALVVLTSVFERNMYRYREPRTFRTIHMDAGHLAGTMWMAARSRGLTAGVYYCDAAEAIEEALGLDGMREGYMLTVALAAGSEPEAVAP